MHVISIYSAELELESRIFVDIHPHLQKKRTFDFPSLLQWKNYLYFTKRHFHEKKSRGLQLYRYNLETKQQSMVEGWQIEE
jgi:hypothetical protein